MSCGSNLSMEEPCRSWVYRNHTLPNNQGQGFYPMNRRQPAQTYRQLYHLPPSGSTPRSG